MHGTAILLMRANAGKTRRDSDAVTPPGRSAGTWFGTRPQSPFVSRSLVRAAPDDPLPSQPRTRKTRVFAGSCRKRCVNATTPGKSSSLRPSDTRAQVRSTLKWPKYLASGFDFVPLTTPIGRISSNFSKAGEVRPIVGAWFGDPNLPARRNGQKTNGIECRARIYAIVSLKACRSAFSHTMDRLRSAGAQLVRDQRSERSEALGPTTKMKPESGRLPVFLSSGRIVGVVCFRSCLMLPFQRPVPGAHA